MANISGERSETILVVDDCDLVRDVLVATLTNAKFVVLAAESGRKALKVAYDHLGRIDLLLAAVEMPGMTGPFLGQELRKSRPDIVLMLTCGDILLGDFGCALIQKPFGSMRLIEMVKAVLHSDDNSQGTRHFSAGSLE
jgi:two-component system cell cycle sensor histidine kinase/response regulator CckA